MNASLIIIGEYVASVASVSGGSAATITKVRITTSVVNAPLRQFEPAIVRVSLTNVSREPLSLRIREGGLPHNVLVTVSSNWGQFKHDQWLQSKEPRNSDTVLGPGESTTGEMLIFFGVPTGFAFSDLANYQIEIAWAHASGIEVSADPLTARVFPGDEQTHALIEELSEFTYDYSGYERDSIRKAHGDEFLVASRILAQIVRQDTPLGFEANDTEKNTRLVNKLRELLEKYPDAVYAGYIARYLGLVEIKSFEREISLAGFDERFAPPAERRAHPAYVAALKLLTDAAKAEVWPRTVAPAQLARLHAMAHEWDKADEVISSLRTAYGNSGGNREADRLVSEVEMYRRKVSQTTGN